MNNRTLLFCALGFALVSFKAANASSQGKQNSKPVKLKSTTAKSERRIEVSTAMDCFNEPIIKLSEALKQDSKTQIFRLSWFFSIGGYQISTTAVYDRQRHTVKQQTYEADSTLGTGGVQRDFYTKVDDEKIHRAASSLDRKGVGVFTFSLLKPFGVICYKTNKPFRL